MPTACASLPLRHATYEGALRDTHKAGTAGCYEELIFASILPKAAHGYPREGYQTE
jgi:hypothetical protein